MYLNFFYAYIHEDITCLAIKDDIENVVTFDNKKSTIRLKFSRTCENDQYLKDMRTLVENSSKLTKIGNSEKRPQVRLHFVKDKNKILPDKCVLYTIEKQFSKLTKNSLTINIEAEVW